MPSWRYDLFSHCIRNILPVRRFRSIQNALSTYTSYTWSNRVVVETYRTKITIVSTKSTRTRVQHINIISLRIIFSCFVLFFFFYFRSNVRRNNKNTNDYRLRRPPPRLRFTSCIIVEFSIGSVRFPDQTFWSLIVPGFNISNGSSHPPSRLATAMTCVRNLRISYGKPK